MAALTKLVADGWHIDDFKLREALAENYDEGASAAEWVQVLSNLDIRDYGAAVIIDRTDKANTLRGPIIVQLSKWENVSFPKINEHTKNDGVCSLILTDGHKSTKAMATEPLSKISGDTPYGSKILLSGNLRFENGILQLNNANTKLLGGVVDKLVEKWRSEKYSSNKADRAAGDAPKWVPFGKRGGALAPQKDGFKAMPGANPESKPGAETNAEFEAARQSEIAALKEVKKNAPNYLKQPETAPKKDLSKPVVAPVQYQAQPPKPATAPAAPLASSGGNGRGQRRRRDDEVDIQTYISRPTGGGTIFDLIKGRLGDEIDDAPPQTAPVTVQESKSYDRYDNRDSNPRRGGANNGPKPSNSRRDQNQYQPPTGRPRQNNGPNRGRNDVHSVTDALSDMSFAPPPPRDYPSDNYRGRGGNAGGRGAPRGGRGGPRQFTNSNYYNNPPPPLPTTIQPLFANPIPRPPAGIEIGRPVVAPYVDGNVSGQSQPNSNRGSRGRGSGRGSSRGNSDRPRGGNSGPSRGDSDRPRGNSGPSRGSNRGRGGRGRGSGPPTAQH